jgi:hypothetical protein
MPAARIAPSIRSGKNDFGRYASPLGRSEIGDDIGVMEVDADHCVTCIAQSLCCSPTHPRSGSRDRIISHVRVPAYRWVLPASTGNVTAVM